MFKEKDVTNHLTSNGISWNFMVPNAPWWGGWWERLIRSVKTSVRKTLGRAGLNFEEITTVLTEIEAVINSRPLTFVKTDEGEPCTLTPVDLLLGRRLTAIPYDMVEVDSNLRRADTIRRHAYRKLLTENFWKQWRKEYLLQLRSAHFAANRPATDFKEGDVVIVHSETSPHQLWKLARVIEVVRSSDGHVRSCKLKQQGGLIIIGPIQKLYPLELRD